MRGVAAVAVDAGEFERQIDVARDTGPWHQRRLLKHKADLAEAPCAARSRQVTSPVEGSVSPAMMRSAVDLPQPEGPSSETNSRSPISKAASRKATTPFGKILLTPRSETMAGPAV